MPSWIQRLLTSVVLVVLGLSYLQSPWGKSLEQLAYDSHYLIRGQRESTKNIIVVGVDEASFDELNMRWPWPRGIHAQLIDSLRESGAKVIGFDLLFSEPSSELEDTALKNAIDRHGNVVLVNEISVVKDPQRGFEMLKVVDPEPIMSIGSKTIPVGFANMDFESDGFVRSVRTLQGSERSFSLALADRFQEGIGAEAGDGFLINFIGPSHSINTISYYQALNPKEFLPKDFLKNSIVLVGFAVASRAEIENSPADHFPVPFSRWGGGVMPGVEIHAHALENLLSATYVKEYDSVLFTRISFFLTTFLGFVFLSVGLIPGAVLFISSILISIFLGQYFFEANFIYVQIIYFIVPLILVYIASPLYHYLKARRERKFIQGAFSSYLSPTLVDELIKNPERLRLGGERRDGTVMFLDIAGFTALSEKLSPEELLTFVNSFLGACADNIITHKGMIDKYIGDCIMAVWSVPLENKNHAIDACAAIMQVQETFASLIKEAEELHDLSFRVGVSSGSVLAGNVGGGGQINYTVLGNEVNLAARLESLNKFYSTTALVSERTYELAKDVYEFRKIDLVQVKGQQANEWVYELIGVKGEADPADIDLTHSYEEAFSYYARGDFESAYTSFQDVLMTYEDFGPATVLMERCMEYSINPPGKDWNGVHVMREK